jgi:hypothetical protein
MKKLPEIKYNKKILANFFLAFGLVVFFCVISSAEINDTFHINLQTTYANGTIQSGTFTFAFNITENSDSGCLGPIVYNHSLTKATDTRGIVSIYLPAIGSGGGNLSGLDFDKQYYLCYYRDGILKEVSQLGRVPYSFRATQVNLSEITVDSNLNMTGFNVTASWFKGIYDWIIGLGSQPYLSFNGTQLNFNESQLNTTIDSRISFGSANDSDFLDRYDSGFFMPLNKSVYGNFDFNGGWTGGGFSISGGDIFAQTVYVYNITSLTVSNLNINGSLFPQEGFDNIFDIGSADRRWRDLYLGGDAVINGSMDVNEGTLFVDSANNRVGIGTATPQKYVDMQGTGGVAIGTYNQGGTLLYVGYGYAGTSAPFYVTSIGDTVGRMFTSLTGEYRGTANANVMLRASATGSNVRNVTIKSSDAYGGQTDRAAGDVVLQTGASRGTGEGAIYFMTTDVGPSGSDANAVNTRMTVAAGGNVGIGTIDPKNKLNVIGDGNFTGNLYAAGNINSTGGDICITGGNCLSDAGSGGSGKKIENSVFQTSHGFNVGNALYYNGSSYLNASSNNSDTLGMFIVSEVVDADNFRIVSSGFIDGLSGLSGGSYYFVSDSVPGSLTTTEAESYSNPILLAINSTAGYVLQWRASSNASDQDIWEQSGWNDAGTQVELVTGSDNVSAGAFFVDNSNGDVGIGTTTPQNTLNVVGDINATGLLYGNGSQLTGISANNIIDDGLYNSSELEEQADGKLGILDSFINLLTDNRVTLAFVKALGFYSTTEIDAFNFFNSTNFPYNSNLNFSNDAGYYNLSDFDILS